MEERREKKGKKASLFNSSLLPLAEYERRGKKKRPTPPTKKHSPSHSSQPEQLQ